MYCLSRGETNEMTTRIFAEKKKASGFLKTTTSKPPRQVSIYCPLKHIFIVLSVFYTKNKLPFKTHLYFSPVFVFEMNQFFIASKENLNTEAVLFSSQCFSRAPRETFLPERLFDLFLLTLCISFFPQSNDILPVTR